VVKEKKRKKRKVIKMRKLFMLLAVLIATPVFALSIDMNDLGSGVVAIEYSDANAQNLPRAFALEFTIEAPATVSLTGGSYKADGVNESGDPQAFGIYPARIVIDGNGNPVSYGSPLADPCDPGSGDGDGSGNLVLEFGSLYDGDGNAPGTSGTLCTLTVDCNGNTEDVNLTMTDEYLYRGGVLLEDGTPVAVDQSIVICAASGECFPSCRTAEYAEWLAVGEPNSWCNVRQCHGDSDGIESNYGPEPPPIFPWPKAWVTSEDLQDLVAGYQETYGGDPDVDDWISADFNRQANNYGPEPPPIFPWPTARVTSEDLSILVANYQESVVDVNCLDCP
jgi:hypothetical protein